MSLRNLHKQAKEHEYKFTYDEIKNELRKALLTGYILGFLTCLVLAKWVFGL